MQSKRIRVLFYSAFPVSPGSGGGNSVFNMLEPCPPEATVYYATPTVYPPHWAPFPELASRVLPYENSIPDNQPPPFHARLRRKLLSFWRNNNLVADNGHTAHQKGVVRQLSRHIRIHKINVLLVCPQRNDLISCARLQTSSGLPSVSWFMDNYYTDESAMSLVSKIWHRSYRRFVTSEAMQNEFSRLYGGQCEVLNNSVTFPDSYLEPTRRTDSKLRIAYAGAINSYYLDVFKSALEKIQELGEDVIFDIYSGEDVPAEFHSDPSCSWRHLPLIPPHQLTERLREYDVLLMLSSFNPEHKAIAQTSLAGKVAAYMAAGRCILIYGPEYAENVGYARRYNFAEVVTGEGCGKLSEAIRLLAAHPDRRRELGRQAYYFGRERHNKDANSARMWESLLEAHNSRFARRAAIIGAA